MGASSFQPWPEIFDEDGNGEVDFQEFIHGVSQFSVKGDQTSKLRFAFRMYDIDNDGFISNGELYQVQAVPTTAHQVMKVITGTNLTDSQLQQMVDKTILLADLDQDGRVSFEEFAKFVGGGEAQDKMVGHFDKVGGSVKF